MKGPGGIEPPGLGLGIGRGAPAETPLPPGGGSPPAGPSPQSCPGTRRRPGDVEGAGAASRWERFPGWCRPNALLRLGAAGRGRGGCPVPGAPSPGVPGSPRPLSGVPCGPRSRHPPSCRPHPLAGTKEGLGHLSPSKIQLLLNSCFSSQVPPAASSRAPDELIPLCCPLSPAEESPCPVPSPGSQGTELTRTNAVPGRAGHA